MLAEGWPPDELERRLRRRERGEPLEWVLGWAAFAGLRLAVVPGVFVPRQRTVALARAAATRLAASPAPQVLLDACTGCGAIACVAARACPDARVVAGDVDPVAVACAAANGVEAVRADLLDGFPEDLRGRVDVVAANVPYVPDGELARLPADAREWEPARALAGGPDGLDVLRRLAAQAPEWLGPGGSLLAEVAAAQVPRAVADLAAHGYALDPRPAADGGDGIVVLVATRAS